MVFKINSRITAKNGSSQPLLFTVFKYTQHCSFRYVYLWSIPEIYVALITALKVTNRSVLCNFLNLLIAFCVIRMS